MTSRVLSRGHGAGGAVAYTGHDAPTAEDPRPMTHARVGGISFRGGLPEFDPNGDHDAQLRLMSRVMQATAVDAPHLKRAAGISARGRRCTKPIETFALSWPAGDRPSWPEMEAAGDSWIAAQGLTDHHLMMTAHVEEGVPYHLQIVSCMVSPVNGLTHKGNRALTGSRWAQQWEQDHGGIVIPSRVERNRLRDVLAHNKGALREKAAAEEEHLRATIPSHEQERLEAEIAALQTIERKVLKEARAAVREQMPATEPTRSEPRSELSTKERADWTRTHDRQRREKKELRRPTTRAGRREHPQRQAALARTHRAEQRELGQQQRALRNLRHVAAESPHVPLNHLVRCPPKAPAWGAPESRQRADHVRGLVTAYQNRGTGKTRQARRTEAAAVETIVDAAVLHHSQHQTTAWQQCATRCRATSTRLRRKTAALARQLGGVTGRITAGLLHAQPPPTNPLPDDRPPDGYSTRLLITGVDAAIRAEHARTVLQHHPTGPRRHEEQRTITRARQAEQAALAAEQERRNQESDRIDQQPAAAAILAMPIHAAAATGRGLLKGMKTAGRMLTAPIRVVTRAVANVGDAGSGAAAYDRAVWSVKRDVRGGLDLRNPTPARPVTKNVDEDVEVTRAAPSPQAAAPSHPHQIKNPTSAPPLAVTNDPAPGDQTHPRR